MYNATTTGTGSAQGHPRNIYTRSASEGSSAAMYTQRGTRASLKGHLSLLRQLLVAAAQSERTTHDVVDRWVTRDPHSSRCTSVSHESRWCFIVATTSHCLIETVQCDQFTTSV